MTMLTMVITMKKMIMQYCGLICHPAATSCPFPSWFSEERTVRAPFCLQPYFLSLFATDFLVKMIYFSSQFETCTFGWCLTITFVQKKLLADGLLINEIFRLLRREGDWRTPLADGFRFWKEFLNPSQLALATCSTWQHSVSISSIHQAQKAKKNKISKQREFRIYLLDQSFWKIDFADHIVYNIILQIVIADHCFCKICKLLFNSIIFGKISFFVCKFCIPCFRTNFFDNFIFFVPDYLLFCN